uniref:Uncharacterized protein n=1 Tax=Rhipicephalus appendiculatus TaxID=34631 RepID=A0A131YED7_RHIAP
MCCGHPLTMFSILYCPFLEFRKSAGEEREEKKEASSPPIYICSGNSDHRGHLLLFQQAMLPDHSVLKWSSDDLLGTLQPLGMKLMP